MGNYAGMKLAAQVASEARKKFALDMIFAPKI